MNEFPISDSLYKNKVRIRVCGLLEEQGKILLLRHERVGPKGYLWSPPGGGLEFGMSAEDTLEKEFVEETNLRISVGQFLFVNEYRSNNIHAMELFFEVKKIGGVPKLGTDPEVPANEQMLSELRFFDYDSLKEMDQSTLHNAFSFCDSAKKIFELRGFYKFEHF